MLCFHPQQTLRSLSLALLAGILLAGCRGHETSENPGEGQLAFDKATKAITEAGHQPANFTHQESYDTNNGRWTVLFQPTAKPRPPGGDLIVWVNLTTGETKIMHGQ